MNESDAPSPERRKFLGVASTLAMGGGLVAGYGTFLAYAGRYLYPPKDVETAWQFVTRIDDLETGGSLAYKLPSGASVVIARMGPGASVADFLALSSTCPHLGCQVHWEAQNDRFFCPCHNGMFDENGVAFSGPPAEAGQSLPRYALNLDNNKLFIEVPAGDLARDGRILERDRGPRGAGHDPILANSGYHRGRCRMRNA